MDLQQLVQGIKDGTLKDMSDIFKPGVKVKVIKGHRETLTPDRSFNNLAIGRVGEIIRYENTKITPMVLIDFDTFQQIIQIDALEVVDPSTPIGEPKTLPKVGSTVNYKGKQWKVIGHNGSGSVTIHNGTLSLEAYPDDLTYVSVSGPGITPTVFTHGSTKSMDFGKTIGGQPTYSGASYSFEEWLTKDEGND